MRIKNFHIENINLILHLSNNVKQVTKNIIFENEMTFYRVCLLYSFRHFGACLIKIFLLMHFIHEA